MSDLTRLTRLPGALASQAAEGASRVGQGVARAATVLHQRFLRGDEIVATGIRRGFESAATRVLARPIAAVASPPAAAPTAEFTSVARNVFTRIDTSRNGYLTHQEITRAMGATGFTAQEGAAVATLNALRNDLENLADDERGPEIIGVSQADLAALDRLPADHATSRSAVSRLSHAQWQSVSSSRELYPNGLASIHAGAINQGSAGDCYFLAPLAGLAAANPQAIRDMIRDNGDGTYTVAFPSGGPITVNAPTAAEIGSYGTGGADGLWVSVVEKAFAELRGQRRLNAFTSDYEAASGGFGGDGIRTLTGSRATTLPTRALTDRQLTTRISEAAQEGRVMAGAVVGIPHITPATRNGLPTRHVYTVMSYDAAANTVRIRNPWGSGGPQGDGIHDVPLAEFRRTIDFISIQNRR